MLKKLMNIGVRELLRTCTNVGKAVSLSAKPMPVVYRSPQT